VGKLRQRGVKALLIGGQQILSYSFWLEARAVAEGIHAIVPAALPATPGFSRTIELLKRLDIIPISWLQQLCDNPDLGRGRATRRRR